jgi:hypothetical protein
MQETINLLMEVDNLVNLLFTRPIQMESVSDAISEIATKLKNGDIKDDDRWHTVKWMTSQKIGLI